MSLKDKKKIDYCAFASCLPIDKNFSVACSSATATTLARRRGECPCYLICG